MKSRPRFQSRSLFALCALALAPAVATAQLPQRVQPQATALLTGSRFLGIGAGVGWDLGPRFDLTVSAVGGRRDGDSQVRIEGVFAFHLNFAAQEGWGFYGGGGLSAHIGTGSREYLLLLVGIERNNRKGIFLEAGVGGGARLTVGWRVPLR